jgi:superfamily II DNA/RNA helicase
MLERRRVKAFLEQALARGAGNNHYEPRAYQSTAAAKSVDELLTNRHAVLTLPTGTGKTVICGMTAALFLSERPEARIIYTAPRRTLLSQLHERSRWLNPTFPIRLVGADPRENDRHVVASFNYARIVFGMPEFLSNRIAARVVPEELVRKTNLLIVDEFDAFLTLRYLARGIAVTFHDALRNLVAVLPPTFRLLLVSATTPEVAVASDTADVHAKIDVSAQTAFRQFLDSTFYPTYVTIAPRFYSDFIPHAQIIAVAVEDASVRNLDEAIDDEVRLLINWISGEVGFHIDPTYVLPRLTQIRAGHLALTPRGSRERNGSDVLAGLLGRLQLMSHLPDFLYEDMAKDFAWSVVETLCFDAELEERCIPVTARRIDEPAKEGGQIVMRAEPKAKFDAFFHILALHPGERGVIFFRNIRILTAAVARLSNEGHRMVVVHGEQTLTDNDQALARFRAGRDMLLLITRDTGKRGLDLPEADFAVFYSPKSREDVTWQEVSRIRSTLRDRKSTYILYYAHTGEAAKMEAVIEALERTSHSKDIRTCRADQLAPAATCANKEQATMGTTQSIKRRSDGIISCEC